MQQVACLEFLWHLVFYQGAQLPNSSCKANTFKVPENLVIAAYLLMNMKRYLSLVHPQTIHLKLRNTFSQFFS